MDMTAGTDTVNNQLQIKVAIGLPVQLKIVFYSSGRSYTTIEIFDQFEVSMGIRRFRYDVDLNKVLVDDLNVLLDEFGMCLIPNAFAALSHEAWRVCDAKYGYGLEGGDAIITIQ